MRKPVIFLVEHDDVHRNQLHSLLLRQAFEVIALPEAEGIFRIHRQKQNPDLLIINASLNAARDGLEVVRLLRQGNRKLPVLLLAPNGSEELAIAALRAGITDYLKPSRKGSGLINHSSAQRETGEVRCKKMQCPVTIG